MVAKSVRKAQFSIAKLLITIAFCVGSSACATTVAPEIAPAEINKTTLSNDDARHLLSRTGIGVAAADLLRYRDMTRQQAIDTVINEFTTQPSAPMPAWVQRPVPHYHARQDMGASQQAMFDSERDAELAQLRQWWTLEMMQTPSPQTERLVLFWHDIFATSYYGTDQQSLAMARQNQTFRSYGLGSWEKLLKHMIRDAALMEFLDAGSNHKGSPNENLARELLELFTLGEGNYDEYTVKEAARSLTGHDTERGHDLAFYIETWQQDREPKTLFGITANHSGDDLIDAVLKQKSAARFLAAKFWSAYLADAKPDPLWLDRVSEKFRESKYQVSALYRAMLESDEFWSLDNRGAIIKSPIDLLVGTARSLEYPKYRWRRFASWQSALGMELFAPPNVSGWKEGGAFVTPGRLLNRYSMMDEFIDFGSSKSITESTGMTMMSAPMMGDARLDSRFKVRLAAEDYQGPVNYQILVMENDQQVWESESMVFAYGHDTAKYGAIENNSEIVWITESIDVPEKWLDCASHISVAFLNDAAGPDGDRNFYIDGIELDNQWLSGSLAHQESACEPEIAANAWRLYCAGTLTFALDNSLSTTEPAQPDWTASAVHIEWANDEISQDRQNVYVTLDHLKTPIRTFDNLQFSLAVTGNRPVRLKLESLACWPSCVTQWPDCAWSNEYFEERKTLVFPLIGRAEPLWHSDRALACHFQGLSSDDQDLVSVLWNSVDELLRQALLTPRAKRFESSIGKMQTKLSSAKFVVSDSPYTKLSAIITLNSAYKPKTIALENLVAVAPTVDSALQLQALLDTVSLPVSSLLLPEIQGVDMKNLPLKDIVDHPVFQLK